MDTRPKIEPKRESIAEALRKYKQETDGNTPEDIVMSNPIANTPQLTSPMAINIPRASTSNQSEYDKIMSKETDPDLLTTYEIVKFPSLGLLYQHKISEVNVEYMTSKDEDLLTTPSLLESGTVLDLLLKRKIKTRSIVPEDLLEGDRNAVLLFLRTSSYGSEYSVRVTDPRNNIPFNTKVDLTKLKYKEITEFPNEFGYFNVLIPMRNKNVTFKLLSVGEINTIFKKAEAIKEAYGEDFSQFSTMKLKSSIISINEKTDRTYIDKFVDAMPALDAFTIRKKILKVSPDVDMSYEFMASDGYKFITTLNIGIDFFFPSI